MILGSSKLKNYSLRWLFKPLRLARFDSFWIRVCVIMAFSRISESNFTNFSEFSSRQNFLNVSVVNFFSPSSQSFPPFIVLFWSPRGTIDSPVLPPGYQSLCCAHRPEGSVFPVLHFFLPFSVVSLKVHGWLPISECAEVMFFTVQLLAILLLYLFSQMGGIPLYRFESPLLLLPFLHLFILVPRCTTHLCHEKSL